MCGLGDSKFHLPLFLSDEITFTQSKWGVGAPDSSVCWAVGKGAPERSSRGEAFHGSPQAGEEGLLPPASLDALLRRQPPSCTQEA
jgi:hypothetical protein